MCDSTKSTISKPDIHTMRKFEGPATTLAVHVGLRLESNMEIPHLVCWLHKTTDPQES